MGAGEGAQIDVHRTVPPAADRLQTSHSGVTEGLGNRPPRDLQVAAARGGSLTEGSGI